MWDFGQILIAQCVVFAMFFLLRIYARSRIPMCTSTTDLSGKTAIVTGANCNIGYFTALDFAKRNARVILACRNKQKAEKARDEIVALSGNKNVVVKILDLSYLRSVRAFAKQINAEESRLDILVNNAGIVSAGKPREVTDEGLETLYAANYFGPFLLTNLLLGLLKKSRPSRIVNVSSVVNKWGTIDFENLQGEKIFMIKNRYYDSKLALTLFTRELAKRLEGTGVTANAVHPGTVSTNVLNHVYTPARVTLQWGARLFGKTAEEGAQPSIYLAVSDEVKDISGKYFVHCSIREEEANPVSRDMNLAEKLWTVSADLTGLTKAE